MSSVKRPCASVFVRVASCIPCCRRINTTSSPAAGLFVVLLVTTPVIDSPRKKPESAATIAAATTTRRREENKEVTYQVYVKVHTTIFYKDKPSELLFLAESRQKPFSLVSTNRFLCPRIFLLHPRRQILLRPDLLRQQTVKQRSRIQSGKRRIDASPSVLIRQ